MRPWARWLAVAVYLFAFALGIFQFIQTRLAIQHGQSPLEAYQLNQQHLWHYFLNPWVFATYLLIVLALLGEIIRAIVKKQYQSNDLWLAAALVTGIVVAVFRFIQAH
jgi:hypothetical protein